MDRMRPPRVATLWGDGMHRDGLEAFAAVQDWDACEPDDYIRIFPRLLPRDGAFPKPLQAHLIACAAVRAWRLQKSGHRQLIPLVAMAADEAMRLGRQRDWFARSSALSRVKGWLRGTPMEDKTVAAERAALERVDSLLVEIATGSLRPFETGTAVQFAFDTGIHPAYLWPEALAAHEMFSAAGWLGHLSRGRRALLPRDLADYFDDILDRNGVSVRDPHMARILCGQELIGEIWRVKERCKHGREAVAVWPRTPGWSSLRWPFGGAAALDTSASSAAGGAP